MEPQHGVVGKVLVEYRYDREKKLLYGSMTGPPDLRAFEEALTAITRSEEFPPDVATIWDLRGLDFAALDRAHEESLIAIRERHPERLTARMALIVDSPLGFGMARMYTGLANEDSTRVFTSFAEAEAWLLATG